MKEKIAEIVMSAAKHLQYEIYDWSILLKGENSKIVIKLDKINSGISLEDCEKYSKLFSSMLDGNNLLENYTLEVSSPGLNRKLRTIQEFSRFIDEPIKVIFDDGLNREVFKGILKKVVGDKIQIYSQNKNIEIEYGKIQSANLDYN